MGVKENYVGVLLHGALKSLQNIKNQTENVANTIKPEINLKQDRVTEGGENG